MKKRILTICIALVLKLVLPLPALSENAFAGVWISQAAESGIGGMVMFDEDGTCQGSIGSADFEGTYTVSDRTAQVHSEGIHANDMTRLALVLAGLHPEEKNGWKSV